MIIIGNRNLIAVSCFIGILLMVAFIQCVEPFEPEVGDYDSTLVVDGLFSNSDQPSIVTLSRSFALDGEQASYISGALVIIEDDLGNQTTLEESANGIYQTDPAAYKGEIGRTYRLLVKTPDGQNFQSEWELMKEAPPIDNLYFEFEEKVPADPNLNPVPGAQFYLDTRDAEGNTRYYRWEFEETFQYALRFPPRIRAEFGSSPGSGDDKIVLIEPDEFEGISCWKTTLSQRIIIATTEDFTEDRVERLPLHFVDNSSPRLYIRYSLLARQYAISKDHFDNLRKIEEINQTSGSLFDPIPNEVLSNITSSDNSNIPVLGYFGVGGTAESRIFLTRDDIPEGFSAPGGPRCTNDTIPLNFPQLFSRTTRENYVLYDYNRNLFGFILGYLLTEPPCASCAANGATNEKPDFFF